MLSHTALRNVVVVENPLSRSIGETWSLPPGFSVSEALEHTGYSHKILETPVLILKNSEPVLEADYDTTVIGETDTMTMVHLPGEGVIAIIGLVVALIAAAVTLYVVLTMEIPETPEGDGRIDALTIGYRSNQRRPGESIPVLYGKSRVFPDVTGNYTYFDSNHNQWMRQIFDVTEGLCDISLDSVFYEDTPITAFEDFEIEKVEPGSTSRLFPTTVHVSTEVENVELVHEATWTSWYAATPIGIKTNNIMVDIVAPKGIYGTHHKTGDVTNGYARVDIEWREIDDNGNVVPGGHSGDMYIGLYTNWINPIRRTVTLQNTDHIPNVWWDYIESGGPIPPSYEDVIAPSPLPLARYEVRIRRHDWTENITTYISDLSWTGLRSSEPDTTVTTTTRVAVAVRQSETLGNVSLSKFSVIAHRRLPRWTGTTWTQPETTSNLCWAFADALKAEYGGKRPDSQIDLETLLALSTRKLCVFNGIFSKGTDLWGALTSICMPMLAKPIFTGGAQYSIVVDDPNQVPIAMFTTRNMIRGSFGINHIGVLSQTHDYTRVVYNEEAEDYRESSVDCIPYGSTSENPKEIKVIGVTNKEAAYEVGIRAANQNRHRRKQIVFDTGVEGTLVTYGDVIIVSHYLLGISENLPTVSGEVRSKNGELVTVWEDIGHFIGEQDVQLYVREDDGEPAGPASVTVVDAHTIQVPDAYGWEPVFYDDRDGPQFILGAGSDFLTRMKVLQVESINETDRRIQGFIDDDNVYIKGDVPDYSEITLPTWILPTVTNLSAEVTGREDSPRVMLTWDGSNSDYYIISASNDEQDTWIRIGDTKDEFFKVVPEVLDQYYVSVQGVGLYAGKRAIIRVDLLQYAQIPRDIAELQPLDAFVGPSANIRWQAPPVGVRTEVRVWWGGELRRVELLDRDITTYSYTYEMAREDGADRLDGETVCQNGTRNLIFQLRGRNEAGRYSLNPRELRMNNPQLRQLANAAYQERGANLGITFDHPAEGDFHRVEVYLSTTQGFTPDPRPYPDGNMVYRGPDNSIIINDVLLIDYGTDYYLRLAAFDVWGKDDLPSYSDEEYISTSDETITGTIDYGNITGAKPPVNATRNIVYIQPGRPSSGSQGDFWLETDSGILYQHDGTDWVLAANNQRTFMQATDPNPGQSPTAGDLWIDTGTYRQPTKRWDGNKWVLIGYAQTAWSEIIDDNGLMPKPIGESGNFFIDGPLNKTADLGNQNFDDYFDPLGGNVVFYHTDGAPAALCYPPISGNVTGLSDRLSYGTYEGHILYYSARVYIDPNVSPGASELQIGANVSGIAGFIGSVQDSIPLAGVEKGVWHWAEGTVEVTDPSSFSIDPFVRIANLTNGFVAIGSLYIGNAPKRVDANILPVYMAQASIDTLRIQGQAVTFPRSVTDSSEFNGSGDWGDALVLGTFTPSASDVPILINWSIVPNATANFMDGIRFMRILRNGVTGFEAVCWSMLNSVTVPGIMSGFIEDVTHGGNPITYSLQLRSTLTNGAPSAGVPFNVIFRGLNILEVKR